MSQLQVTGEAKIRDIQGPVVANAGVITALDGAASQYVRGDGTLADFPTSTGGGSSVSYYLNSSVSQGTIDGNAYRELSKDPIIGTGTDIAISSNGYVANYITDANDPDVVIVPGGNFNCEFYFSVNNNTGSPTTYAELYKYDGSTFTLLGSSSGVPESINQGTTIAPYYFAIPVATATLATTDRLAIRIYVNVDGRTITLHTENSHLCQVVTTLSKGMVSLNNLTDQSQYLTTGTSGTDFNIVSSGDTHTFNIPSASSSNRGLITTGTQTIAGNKTFSGLTNFNNSIGVEYFAYFDGDGTTGNGGILIKQYSGAILAGVDYTTLFATPNQLGLNFGGAYNSFLQATSLTANRTYTLPDLSGTLALLEGSQTFTGIKTFNLSTINETGIQLKNDIGIVPVVSGYTNLNGLTNGLAITNSSGVSNNLLVPATIGYSYTFPASSGTLALTSDLSSYVPYTGATGDLNLGAYYLKSKYIYAEGGTTEAGILALKVNSFIGGPDGYNTISAVGKQFALISFVSGSHNKSAYLNLTALTDSTPRTFTFPDASGTLALTSNLSAYVPYTGASGNVDLGANNLVAKHLIVNGVSGSYGGSLLMKQNANAGLSNNYTSISSSGLNFVATAVDGAGVLYEATFNLASITTNRSYTLPNASGTIALTSNLSSYVPYTGATANVELGNYRLIAGSIFASPSSGEAQINFKQTTTGNTIYVGHSSIWSTGTNLYIATSTPSSASKSFNFDLGSLTDNTTRTYTLPDSNGTLALTSEFSGYLPLTGGTLTGALSGTSATFSGQLHIPNNSTGTLGGLYFDYNANAASRTWQIVSDYDAYGDFQIRQSTTQTGSTYSKILGFSPTGAATFSSNVTAAQLIVSAPTSTTYGSLNATTSGYAYQEYKYSGTAYGYIGQQSSFIGGSSNTDLGIVSVNNLIFGTGGSFTERLRVTSSGQLGLGVVPKTWWGSRRALEIFNGGAFAGVEDGRIEMWGNAYLNSTATTIYLQNGYASLISGGNHNGIIFYTAPSGTAGDAVPFTEKMRITSDGTVGVAVSSPIGGVFKLQVGDGSADTRAIIVSNQVYQLGFRNGASNPVCYDGSDTNGNRIFSNNVGTELMRITNGGNVLIGTTTDSGARLNITGTTTGVYITRVGGYASIIGATDLVLEGGASGGKIIYLNPYSLGAVVVGGLGTGTVYSNGGQLTNTNPSDERLKENITNIGWGLDEILKLRPVHYTWKDDKLKQGVQFGFIAQEVQEVMPDAIKEFGEDVKYLGLEKDAIYATLVKAIQELKLEIDQLKNK